MLDGSTEDHSKYSSYGVAGVVDLGDDGGVSISAESPRPMLARAGAKLAGSRAGSKPVGVALLAIGLKGAAGETVKSFDVELFVSTRGLFGTLFEPFILKKLIIISFKKIQ